jgi:hypothetical protein
MSHAANPFLNVATLLFGATPMLALLAAAILTVGH